MYRIRLLYDVRGWAYWRRCRALARYAPEDFGVTIGGDYGRALADKPHDLVLQLCYSHARDLRRHCEAGGYKDLVIVSGFNIGWNYANKWFNDTALWSDHVIINNRECFEKLGRPDHAAAISNGVDREIYRILTPPADRVPKAIWVGSKFHASTKRYDSVLKPLKEKLVAAGWEVDFRVADSHGGATGAKSFRGDEEMVRWYNSGTVYVVASSSEGTPNPALEAAGCGCVVVSTRVGNMPELIEQGVNGELVDKPAALFDAIERCRPRYLPMQAAMERILVRDGWDWQNRAAQYYDLFRRLIEAKRAGALGPPEIPPDDVAVERISAADAKGQLRNAVQKHLQITREAAGAMVAGCSPQQTAAILGAVAEAQPHRRAECLKPLLASRVNNGGIER